MYSWKNHCLPLSAPCSGSRRIPGILDTLAEVHFRMGNAEKAVAVIDQAIALAPDDNYLQGQRQRFLGN